MEADPKPKATTYTLLSLTTEGTEVDVESDSHVMSTSPAREDERLGTAHNKVV